jgi:hypothetical protein
MTRWLLTAAAGAAALTAQANAHHSIAGAYDGTRQVTVDGTVAQFHFVNPHPFLHVDVKDAAGRVVRWQLEMDNRGELADIGFTAGTLKPGDRIVATGSVSRTQAQSLYVRRLERPADGFRYEQVGSRPKITAGRP